MSDLWPLSGLYEDFVRPLTDFWVLTSDALKVKVNTVVRHYCVYFDFWCVRRYNLYFLNYFTCTLDEWVLFSNAYQSNNRLNLFLKNKSWLRSTNFIQEISLDSFCKVKSSQQKSYCLKMIGNFQTYWMACIIVSAIVKHSLYLSCYVTTGYNHKLCTTIVLW